MMRRFDYFLIPGVGSGKTLAHGDTLTLLFSIPYLLWSSSIIPPKRVLDRLLATGESNAGMSGGCEWEQFAIDDSEYGELVDELEKIGFICMEPPDSVVTSADWTTWCIAINGGIPPDELRALMSQIDELQRRASTEPSAYGEMSDVALKVNELVREAKQRPRKYPAPMPYPERVRPKTEN